MALRKWIRYAVEGAVLFVVFTLVAGSVLGQPVLLSYVETGSMSPTLEQGDGFVAVPIQVAGSVTEGDVIVFEAEEIQGGGLTTHRVVETADNGYVTKGDANPFSDQTTGEPSVKRPQIVAKALRVNGQVVVIPHLGTAFESVRTLLKTVQRRIAVLLGTRSLLGVQGVAYLFFAVTFLWYAIGILRSGDSKTRDRNRSRENGTNVRYVIALFAVVLVLASTVSMAGSTQRFEVVSSDSNAPGLRVIPTGESESAAYRVRNNGLLPVVTYFEPASDGINVHPRRKQTAPRSSTSVMLTLSAPPENGLYRRFLVEHRYFAILPSGVIHELYTLHPWAPIVAIDALIGVPFYLVGVALAGGGRLRDRSRDRDHSLTARLRRAVMGR